MAEVICDVDLGGKLLERFLEQAGAGGTVTLTGAGISTDSGIPDYRGPSGAARRHSPMTYQQFVSDEPARRRYWARSFVGWGRIDGALPNAGHQAVTALQRAGLLSGLITQNVDGLHQAAGAAEVIELHGGLQRVRCLDCAHTVARSDVHDLITGLNPGFAAVALAINPDGDAELDGGELGGFVAPACPRCGSPLLKPDVVFFGESVPAGRVARCARLVEEARAVLVLGSSLTVFSGFRFVRAASRRGIAVAIVNQGPTRADDLATLRLDAPLGAVLPALAGAIRVPSSTRGT